MIKNLEHGYMTSKYVHDHDRRDPNLIMINASTIQILYLSSMTTTQI